LGVRQATPVSGQRLNLAATLKAAAPWQGIRRKEAATLTPDHGRIRVRPEDFHIKRFKARRETTTIFVVDASGSAAAQRLAEAKGAVELLLAQCYVRRDQVAVIAFRGSRADLLLPPTRALARAKRELAALPGGGGTPLATGIDAARELATELQRKGQTPVVVMMTDGRANICRDGSPGHERANEEALAAARLFRAAEWSSVIVDTANRPRSWAKSVANAMGAQYFPLPYAQADVLSDVIRTATSAK
jgi:magnesium chelatase subunit D